MLRDAAAAEDVVANAFERAYRKHRQFDARRGTARAWVFGIARNAALDELRRVARPRGSSPPDDALHNAVRILGAITGGLLVALEILLPAAVFGGALWAGTRTLRRRGRERALDAA